MTRRQHKKPRGILITVTRNNIDMGINRIKITRKKNWKKYNCMDISSNKQAKCTIPMIRIYETYIECSENMYIEHRNPKTRKTLTTS